jgi:hypothetical protein
MALQILDHRPRKAADGVHLGCCKSIQNFAGQRHAQDYKLKFAQTSNIIGGHAALLWRPTALLGAAIATAAPRCAADGYDTSLDVVLVGTGSSDHPAT